MKRRDFLRLATGVLVSLGLRVEPAEVDTQDDWDFVTGRFDSMTPIEVIKSCDAPAYIFAWNEKVLLESFDGGLTWSEIDANST